MIKTCKRILIIFWISLLPNALGWTQSTFLKGLGIEAGIGQNNLFWSKQTAILTPGFRPMDHTEFWITPNVRLTYEIPLPLLFSFRSFMGYNQFGGMSSENIDGYYLENRWSFKAIEVGSLLLARFRQVHIGAGLKANRYLRVKYIIGSFEGELFSANNSDWFKKWSYDAGACVTYPFSHFHISLEGWFGLTDLCDLGSYKNKDGWIHENHYRVILGYSL